MITIDIERALQDAGCSNDVIQRFMKSSCLPEKLSMLAMHRTELLDRLHEYQQKLQRLDFILHLMRKNVN